MYMVFPKQLDPGTEILRPTHVALSHIAAFALPFDPPRTRPAWITATNMKYVDTARVSVRSSRIVP